MVNFGLLAAENVSLVWGTPANFNGFRVMAALLHGTLVVGVSQTAAFNRGRHLYSSGRPSGWALAHISSFYYFYSVLQIQTLRTSIFPLTASFFANAFSMQSFVYSCGFLPSSIYLQSTKSCTTNPSLEHCVKHEPHLPTI